jgi:DNA invertase Pin-like site-specific DNA recombinase
MSAKPLRFAVLIRVSTEKQKKRGESLRTQETNITNAVATLGDEIVARYGGQEHGTAGWERAELDRLLADAQKQPRPFDAIMVTEPSRWSRDNLKNEIGLDILRKAGVKFFLLTSEKDLHNPDDIMFLRLYSVINAAAAAKQNKNSIENRIHRAERGIPTAGSRPRCRIWDKEQEKFVLDPEKQEAIQDIAERFLIKDTKESLPKRQGIRHAPLDPVENLPRVLRRHLVDPTRREDHYLPSAPAAR